jgi:hypothetical protein
VRTPLTVIALLLAILVPIGFATDDGPDGSTPAPPQVTPLETVAHRVERLRGLTFRTLPRPLRVTAEEARREGLADLDRGYPAARRHADEALYIRLGLLPAGTDLREVSASVFGEQVAGYYDPRTGRLRLVEGAGGDNAVMDEVTLAHELTHALEDQRFDLDVERTEASDDGALAYTALVEGTATALMLEYLGRHFSGDDALGGLLASAFAGGGDTSGIPPFVLASLVFPYERGQQFVAHLHRRAGRRWTLVDLALEARPPVSTEQILHPEKWIRVEVPRRVRPLHAGAILGDGWKRLAGGSFGEFQTAQLLARGSGDASRAAAGWGGDRYELWRHAGDDAVVLRWRWDTARDAEEFLPALRSAVAELPHAAVASRAGETTLALAPDDALAQRLAAG